MSEQTTHNAHDAPQGALSGVRVIDLTRIIAGPFCSQLLADLGADVIKIESPRHGDPVRHQGAMRNGLSYYFAQFNRNKRSLTLDLYTDEGKAVLARALERADVLIENYRPGVLAEMGFDDARLRTLNPRLIVCDINGYGSTGPYAQRPAFDFIAQAMSGFMSVTGSAEGEPMRAGPPISDLIAGLYAAFGTVAALYERGHAGSERGQRVESSLTNGLMSLLAYFSANYFATGQRPNRLGNDHPVVYPYGLFHAADGIIAIAPSNDTFVARLMQALDLMPLLERAEFADNASRCQHREALRALINERTRTRSVAEWIERLNAAGVPCGEIMDIEAVMNDPQILAQQMVIDVEHPGAGPVRMTGFPLKLSATPARVRRASPRLGEHNEAVLRELGYSDEDIAGLIERAIV